MYSTFTALQYIGR